MKGSSTQHPWLSLRTIGSSVAIVAATFLGASSELLAQAPPVAVYTLLDPLPSPTAEKVTALIQGALRRSYRHPAEESNRPDVIHRRLVELDANPSPPLVFVVGTRATIAELARADELRPVLHRLALDPINPRSAGVPFYLFARAETINDLEKTAKETKRVAFGVSQTTRDEFDPDQAKAVLQPIFGVSPHVVRTTNDHAELLDYLLTPDDKKRVHFVGIYDEEPSILLNDFLELYRPSAAVADALRLQLYLLPTKNPRFAPELRRAPVPTRSGGSGPSGSTFAIVPDQNLYFHDLAAFRRKDGHDGLLTISIPGKTPTRDTDTPIVLTNVRGRMGNTLAARQEFQRLQQVVSFAYLATLLTDVAGKRCEGAASPLFQTYLLQAFYTDPVSLTKGLSLWTNLQFTSAPNDDPLPVESDLIKWLVNERLKPLKTSLGDLDYQKVVASLTPARAQLSVREQFSNDDAELFRGAADQIRAMVQNPGANTGALAAPRRVLYELLLKRQGPTCELPGLGLFGEKGYDPFLYLSVIDSLISLQPAS